MSVGLPPFKAGDVPNPRDHLDVVGEQDPPEPVEPPNLDPDEDSPLGYVIDRATGERRPKKKAGRPPRHTAPRAAPRQDPPAADREPDMVPGRIQPPERSRGRQGRPVRDAPEVPPFRAGPIAKGINRLYRKAGKIVRVWDAEIGQALIECTRKDIDPDTGEPDPEDTTVGEAWEEIAKVNPRVRRILLKLIEGGAWGQLFMAHAPILLAILMKESVMRRLPTGRLLAAFMDDSEAGDTWEGRGASGVPSMADMMSNLTQEDVGAMMATMSQFMPPGGMTAMYKDVARMNHRPPVVDDFGIDDGGL